MVEIVVYLDKNYQINESIFVSDGLTKEQITAKVNEHFGEKGWYYYDILSD